MSDVWFALSEIGFGMGEIVGGLVAMISCIMAYLISRVAFGWMMGVDR